MSEKREFLRVPLDFMVKLQSEVDQAAVIDGRTQNLSLRGVYVNCEHEIEIGRECVLVLQLGEGEHAVKLEIEGTVVRSHDGGVALEFQSIRGVETMEHLRKLVMYNARNASEVEEEIRLRRGIERLPSHPRPED